MIGGAGGGLGHIAVQLASRGMAMRVIGIDAPSKKSLVLDCGAEHFVDVVAHDDKSIAEEVMKLTGGLGAQAVIVCTASNKAYAQALDFIKFDGTVVCVGMPVCIFSMQLDLTIQRLDFMPFLIPSPLICFGDQLPEEFLKKGRLLTPESNVGGKSSTDCQVLPPSSSVQASKHSGGSGRDKEGRHWYISLIP